MENREALLQRLEELHIRLCEKYDTVTVGGRDCFLQGDNHYFRLNGIVPFGAVVLEHADGIEEAEVNRFEDGDLFYLDELSTDEMFECLVAEIEED